MDVNNDSFFFEAPAYNLLVCSHLERCLHYVPCGLSIQSSSKSLLLKEISPL